MAILERILDALYPESVACFVCNQEAIVDEHGFCATCATELRACTFLPCSEPLDGLYASWFFDPILHNCIHRFKYSHAKYLAKYLAACIHLPSSWQSADCLVPVPLHPQKQRERSYNQSALLAHALSHTYHIPVDETILMRIKKTASQTHLTRKERRQNVEHAFKAVKKIPNRVCILVDDVVTTGSTLQACAQSLKDAGAHAVFAVCACAQGEP